MPPNAARLLIEAKELVQHGDWLPWLESNTEVVPRQCQKYMRLAENWDEIEAKCESGGTYFGGINDALKLIAKPKPKPSTSADLFAKLEHELRKGKPAPSPTTTSQETTRKPSGGAAL